MTRLILAIALLFSTPAWAEEVLYCQSELATGLYKENGRWQTANFTLECYTVKFNDDYSVMSGLTMGGVRCHKPYSTFPEIVCNDTIKKRDVGRTFNYNPKTNRFIYTIVGTSGYIMNTSDTDVIYAGTCQKF